MATPPSVCRRPAPRHRARPPAIGDPAAGPERASRATIRARDRLAPDLLPQHVGAPRRRHAGGARLSRLHRQEHQGQVIKIEADAAVSANDTNDATITVKQGDAPAARGRPRRDAGHHRRRRLLGRLHREGHGRDHQRDRLPGSSRSRSRRARPASSCRSSASRSSEPRTSDRSLTMSIITQARLDALRTSLSLIYNEAYRGASYDWSMFANQVPSDSTSTLYGWLAQQLVLSEEVHARTLEHVHEIVNRPSFEGTVDIDRDKLEDDKLVDIYRTQHIPQLGEATAKHPDILISDLMTGNALPGPDPTKGMTRRRRPLRRRPPELQQHGQGGEVVRERVPEHAADRRQRDEGPRGGAEHRRRGRPPAEGEPQALGGLPEAREAGARDP